MPEDSHNGILVVDDEDVIRQLFQMILSDELYPERVDTACNGAEAVERFRQHRYDVLLLDLFMPVMDGVEAFERIQQLCAENAWIMPHVVFCTGFAPPASICRAIEHGDFHTLLMKPVTNDMLLSTVRGYLDRSRSNGA